MKLTTNQETLSQAVALASRAVANRPSRPILSNMLLEVQHKTLKVTGFNEVMAITVETNADIEYEGEVTVPAKLFSDIVSRLQGVVAITLDRDSYQLSLETLGSRFTLSTLPAEDWPVIGCPEHPVQFSVPAPALLDWLEFVTHTISTDERKEVLTGAHLSIDGDGLEFASTDGHRLAVFSADTVTESLRATIPGAAISAITRMLKGFPGDVTITADEPGTLQVMATFEIPGQRVLTRLLEGQYPDYRRLLPKQFDRVIELDRKPVIEALERVEVVASQKNGIIKLDAGDSLTISCEVGSVGSAREVLQASLTGEPITVAFNVEYLLKALKAFPQDTVYLHMNTPTSPAVLQGPGPERKLLIMPIQIRELEETRL